MFRSRVMGSFAVLLISLMAGCNRSDFDMVRISGVVTLDGQPVSDAMVSFNPRAKAGAMRAGPDSYGRTDATGRFELETIHGDPGAVVATHRVSIRTRRMEETPEGEVQMIREELLPSRYHDSTELTFDVTTPTESADFQLTSEPAGSQ